MSHVTEPEKRVPVVDEADVVVAGGSVAGVFAAMAAARNGARTVLVERFGSVGGNIGPGMIVNGHMVSGRAHEKVAYECTIKPRLYGLGKEFIDRYAEMGGGSIPPYTQRNYPGDASIASYVALKMLEESGVRLLLSTTVADPVLEDGVVRGLYVENKSGRQAVTARVVVDATGEADVARRAGAATLYPKVEYHEIDGHAPTGMGILFLVGHIDWSGHDTFRERARVGDEDLAWARETYGDSGAGKLQYLLPFLRSAAEKGEYAPEATVDLGGESVHIKAGGISPLGSGGIGQGSAAPNRVEGKVDAGNGNHMSALEVGLRSRIFETVHFYRQYVPGFESASLLCIAPFLGSRGGPCIEGEHVLTMDDCQAGRRFDDVLYLYGEFRALRYTASQGEPKWVDVPYRALLPKTLDGLIAVGRSASGIPDTLLRNRMAAKVMGEAGGTAAAMAAERDIPPRQLDVTELQGRLLDAGFYLGDRHRLKELQLV